MIVRTPEEREGVIEAGKRLGAVLEELSHAVRPGITTRELDAIAEKLIRDGGDVPSFKGYRPDGAPFPFPAALCISVNDEVVHGIPGDRVIKEGDIVNLDLGLTHKGFIMDSALTVPVGTVPKETLKLLDTTQTALAAAIETARPGARVGDISFATQESFSGTGFSVVKVLGGHGVGAAVHEEPFIANAGHPGTGPEIKSGMVLALEPIANAGKAGVMIASDGYTYRTKDGSISAHFEHTILVEDNETLILTKRPSE
ncbi:MAG: type I methionyl aminopeptidase [Candidatus Pacebacteria bacterium]|nr:type I methionyl aminopeptidase [Candidatus Paceibacterota bacterium]